MKSILPLSKWVLTAASLVAPTLRADADELRYDWRPVPHASFYGGRITKDGSWSYFRTTDTWLILERGSLPTVEAFDAQGHPLRAVKPKVSVQPPPRATPPSAPETRAAPEPEPTPPEPAPPAAAEPQALHPPAPADAEAPQAQAPARKRLKTPAAAHVSVHLGIGKEWVTAHAGISSYKGAANIGGTILRGDWRPEGRAWYLAAEAGAHDFTTTTHEQSAAGGAGTDVESKFLRADAWLGAFYDFGAGTGTYRLGVGAGLGYVRLPALAVTDPASAVAELKEQSAAGPFVGLAYERYLTPLHTLGIAAGDMPLSFGKAPAATAGAGVAYWRYAFVKSVYTELGVSAARATAKLSASCPAAADGCDQAGAARADLVQARMGIGAQF